VPVHDLSLWGCMLGYPCADRSTLIAVADFRNLNKRRHECLDIPEPLAMSFAINDVRPAGSPGMIWWYGFSFRMSRPGQCGRYRPGAQPDPYSLWSTQVIGYGPTAKGSLQSFLTYNEPESFYYQTLRFPFGGYIRYLGWHVHGINFQLAWLFDKTPADLFLPAFTTMPMLFNETVPQVSAAQLAAKMDRAGPLCWSLKSEDPERAGAGACGAGSRKHIAQFTVMTSIGIFGGVPANTTASGHVYQHMGIKSWYIADDGLSHSTASFGGTEVDQYLPISSVAEVIIRTAILGTHSPRTWRFQLASAAWMVIAALVGLPAAIGACCSASARPKVKNVGALASLVLALVLYRYYVTVLAVFAGNTRDRYLIPPAHDLLLILLLLVPALAFALPYGRIRARISQTQTKVLNRVRSFDAVKDEEPMLNGSVLSTAA